MFLKNIILMIVLPFISGETPNGIKLKNLINCFAWWQKDAAYRPDNSHVNGCNEIDILYCRTDKGDQYDHFCKFDGTNVLQDVYDWPSDNCYYNCQMETCDAWKSPQTQLQYDCVNALNNNN